MAILANWVLHFILELTLCLCFQQTLYGVALHFRTDHEQSGSRVDHFFIKDKKITPQSLIAKYLRKGLIRLDGKRTTPSQRLLPGQTLTYPQSLDKLRQSEPPSSQAKPRPLAPSVIKAIRSWILTETRDFVVLMALLTKYIENFHASEVEEGEKSKIQLVKAQS